MRDQQVGTQQAREKFSDLISHVHFAARPVEITRNGKPFVQVTPLGDPWVIEVSVPVDVNETAWQAIDAPEVVYTNDIHIQICDVEADNDDELRFGGVWRTRAWPGSNPAAIDEAHPYAEEIHRQPLLDADSIDVIEISADNTDDSASDVGQFAVQTSGELIAMCDTLGQARDCVRRVTGRHVALEEAGNYFSGARYIPA